MKKVLLSFILILTVTLTVTLIPSYLKTEVELPLYKDSLNGSNFNFTNPYVKIKSYKKIEKIKLLLNLNELEVNIPIKVRDIKNNQKEIKIPVLLPGTYTLKFNGEDKKFIVEEGLKNKFESNIENCLGEEGYNKVLCFKKYFYTISLKDNDPEKNILELENTLSKYPELKNNCHAYSHVIGENTGLLSKNIVKSLLKGSNICEYGYYHGVMESYSMRSTDEEFDKFIKTFCTEYKLGFNQGSCYHSLGHMIWIREGGNFKNSVSECQKLRADPTSILSPQENCISGIAMNWAHAYQDAPKKYKSLLTPAPDEPVKICLEIKDLKQQSGCWAFIGGIYNDSIESINHYKDICQNLPEITSNTCWLNVGFILGFETNLSEKEALDICSISKYDSAMWSCFGNTLSNRTILTKKKGMADRVCELSREINRFDKDQCIIMRKEEELRINQPTLTHLH